MLVLLFTSVLAVTLVSKIPGGSPVLGFLLGGVAVGPFTTGLIHNVHQARGVSRRSARPTLNRRTESARCMSIENSP